MDDEDSIPEVVRSVAQSYRAHKDEKSTQLLQTFQLYKLIRKQMTPRRRSFRRLLDLEGERMRDMDANGVDVHLLSLTAPGVQMFDADTALELSALANDRMAEVIKKHPTRFAGLASFAPQSPKRAAKEMERAIKTLKLNGFVVNSHTNSEYFDDQKYWPVLEAAEALDACIYIHPRAPSDGLAAPFGTTGSIARSGATESRRRRTRCA